MPRMILASVCFLTLACQDAATKKPLSVDGLGWIVNGTRESQEVPLSDGQRLAIGWLHYSGSPSGRFCTGTLIAPRVVMTASHCTVNLRARDIGFGVGLDPWSARAAFQVTRIYEHDRWDAAILVLAQAPQELVPEIVPIAFNQKRLDQDWRGRLAEGAGYGETRNRNRRGRWFAVVRIVRIMANEVVVDGEGVRGICFGDSGGPLLYAGDDGVPRVLAVESRGDSSCVGQDWMTRLDALEHWIQPVVDDANANPQSDPEGGEIINDCQGLDYFGRCDGTVMEYCYEGEVRRKDCGEGDQICQWADDERGYDCVSQQSEEGCGEIDYFGRCDGDVSEYCYEGELRREDCGAEGQTCDWVNNRQGYDCVEAEPSGGCQGVDYFGRCDGDVVEYCYEGELRREDCDQRGQDCGWINRRTGYYCE